MASAMEGFRRGYREFLLLGGTGGRLDHTVANFAVLYYLLRRGARAVMADTHNRVELKLPGSYRLEPEEGYKFSLFPYAGEVTMEQGLPKSRRDARYHGFGMKSIARIAEKYGGSVAIKAEDGMFYLDILLVEL